MTNILRNLQTTYKEAHKELLQRELDQAILNLSSKELNEFHGILDCCQRAAYEGKPSVQVKMNISKKVLSVLVKSGISIEEDFEYKVVNLSWRER